jgi:hypothetical protein
MTISDKELAALRNLAQKQAGKDVDWINIADARALTELGLARRSREGWEITTEGLALVKASPPAGPTLVTPTELPLRGHAPEGSNDAE